jgi:hypothetical protein
MQPIEIKTSLIHIPLIRDGVKTGEVSFNPNDNVFFETFYAMIGEFEEKEIEYKRRAKELDNKNSKENPLASIADGIALRRESCEYFMDKIDELFGEGTAKMAFGSTLEPEVIGQFFDGIKPVFFEIRKEKMKKYTKKESSTEDTVNQEVFDRINNKLANNLTNK